MKKKNTNQTSKEKTTTKKEKNNNNAETLNEIQVYNEYIQEMASRNIRSRKRTITQIKSESFCIFLHHFKVKLQRSYLIFRILAIEL